MHKFSNNFSIQFKTNFSTVFKIQLKREKGDFEIKIDDGQWKSCSIQNHIDAVNQRFTLKCNLNGVVTTFSAVITTNHIDVFNDVSVSYILSFN